MSTFTGKVFRAGNSKALRLSRGLKVTAEAYQVTLTAMGFVATTMGIVATDPAATAQRLKALKALHGSAPNFPDHTM